MPKVSVDVNCQCEVTLTTHGAKVWNDFIAGIPHQTRMERNSVLRTTLWELMHVYGPLMTMGQSHDRMPFRDNIIFIEGAT